MTGLMIRHGNQATQSVNIQALSKDNINDINQYMLSIGIKTNYKVYTSSDIDLLYRKFLYNIEDFADLSVITIVDWKTQYIQSIKLNVTNNNMDTLTQIKDTLQKHTAANYFLKMQPPEELQD